MQPSKLFQFCFDISFEKNLNTYIPTAYIIENTDEIQNRNLVVDLNKQRVKTGEELRNEFNHHCKNYPAQKGIRDYNRLKLISDETSYPEERVKKFIRLESELGGTDFDSVVAKIFGGELSLHQGLKLCNVLKNQSTKSINI